MDQDKRKGDEPIPRNLNKMLNDSQRAALTQLENFGWQLQFVRHPLFQEPVVVVVNPEGREFGVLEDDGRINMEAHIAFREKK
ncbi:hypothetical protein [Zhongshania sp.]|uniref:hypothetical protein n=1 Tax=Zhongshania sp. TaxID=1971902 RepID=UPI003562EA89